MSEPRRPERPRPDSDPILEQRLRDWLGSEPDRPPEQLATAASQRARRTTQRPGWLASLRQGWGARRGRGPQLVAATASLVAMVLVAGVIWQLAANPPDNGASTPPSSAVSTPGPTVPATPGATAAPSVAPTAPPFDGRATTVGQLDRRATALGSGFGSLWLGDAGGRLMRIEPASGDVTATIDLGAVPCGPIVTASSSIWLTTCGEGVTSAVAVTVRIDPETNLVTNTYDSAGGDGIGIAAMNGLVWFVSDVSAGTLTAVDAATGAHVRDLSVGVATRQLTAGFGSLWVSPVGRAAVLRLDPDTGAELAAVPLSGDVGYLVTAGDAIWVAEPHQWLVGRIDPVTDKLSVETGASPGVAHLVIADSGLVWSLAGGEAMAIDPASNGTVDRFVVPAHLAFDAVGTHVLAVVGEVVWFADGLSLFRIAPS